MGQPRRIGPKWTPGYDIGYTFVRNNGFLARPAIKTLKKLPDEFVSEFNSQTGAYLFYRDGNAARVGVNSTLEALRHYFRIGALEGVRVCTFSELHNCPFRSLSYSFLVLMDNEAAENSEEIIQYCNSIGIIVLNFPPYLGHLLNICDNRVHATIQKSLDKIQQRFSNSNSPQLREKYIGYLSAYKSVTKEEILNSLESIGFGKLESISEVEKHFQRTLSEGLPNHREQHVLQLEAFLNDCIDNGYPIPTTPYSFRLPGDLWDVYYDAIDLEVEIHGSQAEPSTSI